MTWQQNIIQGMEGWDAGQWKQMPSKWEILGLRQHH